LKKNKGKNYLDFIAEKNPEYNWFESEDGFVTVDVINKGAFNTIAQIVFKKPKISHIELDKFGSFVWKQIDGNKTIYDISKAVKQNFGKEAEPIIERLVMFFKILHNNRFILYKRAMK